MKRVILCLLCSVCLLSVVPAQATFVADNNGNLYNYDITTGSSSLIGNSGVGAWYDIALNPTNGSLYGITGYGYFYSIDPSTGTPTYIGKAESFINGLTFDSSGTLYGSGGQYLYTLDLASGSATQVGSTGFNSSGDLAFDADGNLYLTASASGGSNGDQLVAVDASTGASRKIGDIGYRFVYGLSFVDSTLYGFTSGQDILNINMGSGLGTGIGTTDIAAYGATGGNAAPVPEPATMLLFGSGLAGLACYRNKKK